MGKVAKKILVADKDIQLVEFLQDRIKDGRFQFILATNADNVKKVIENTTFFAAIVDFEAKDVLDNKVIDLLISKNIPVIPTVETLTLKVHKELLQYPIIDYVIRNNIAGKGYLSDLLQGLEYFSNKKVLICIDSNSTESINNLKQVFHSLLFTPIFVDSANEAMNILLNEPSIKIIYIDYQLKDKDGIELCTDIKTTFLKREFLIFGGTEEIDETTFLHNKIKGEFLKSGIDDFLSKPIDKERFNTHILSMMKMVKHKHRLDTYVSTVDKYVLVSITTLGGVIVYASDAFCEICGYSKDELIGHSHSIIRHPDMPSSIYRDMWSTIKSGHVWKGEIKNKKKNGDFYWVNSTIEPIYDEFGTVMGYQSVRFDITDKKYIEEISVTDKLTGLYNRRKFDEIFTYELNQLSRYPKDLSILMLDIDHFKIVNDTFGHQVGDDVLFKVSSLLQNCLRKTDTLFRWGGEEFIILCPYTNLEHAEQLAQKIRKQIEEFSFDIVGHKTISIGLSSIQFGDTVEEIITKTDKALYKAKENGRNRVEVGI
ncbi:MAG: diguanylate cyclase [Arcobacteraceae bacterium]|nr:diguanylate cyclase [Arcobacteraceae bacterium]